MKLILAVFLPFSAVISFAASPTLARPKCPKNSTEVLLYVDEDKDTFVSEKFPARYLCVQNPVAKNIPVGYTQKKSAVVDCDDLNDNILGKKSYAFFDGDLDGYAVPVKAVTVCEDVLKIKNKTWPYALSLLKGRDPKDSDPNVPVKQKSIPAPPSASPSASVTSATAKAKENDPNDPTQTPFCFNEPVKSFQVAVDDDYKFVGNNCHDHANAFCDANSNAQVLACHSQAVDGPQQLSGHTVNLVSVRQMQDTWCVVDPQVGEECCFTQPGSRDTCGNVNLDLRSGPAFACVKKMCNGENDPSVATECQAMPQEWRAKTHESSAVACAEKSTTFDGCNTCCFQELQSARGQLYDWVFNNQSRGQLDQYGKCQEEQYAEGKEALNEFYTSCKSRCEAKDWFGSEGNAGSASTTDSSGTLAPDAINGAEKKASSPFTSLDYSTPSNFRCPSYIHSIPVNRAVCESYARAQWPGKTAISDEDLNGPDTFDVSHQVDANASEFELVFPLKGFAPYLIQCNLYVEDSSVDILGPNRKTYFRKADGFNTTLSTSWMRPGQSVTIEIDCKHPLGSTQRSRIEIRKSE